MLNNKIILILCLFLLFGSTAEAQRRKSGVKPKTPAVVVELTEEEKAEMEKAERRQKHAEEIIGSTRKVTFVDSLVTDKDNFIARLGLSDECGRFMAADRLFSADDPNCPVTGKIAFVNSLSSTVFFSAADTTDVVKLHAAYRNGNRWSAPSVLEGLDGFDYQDYPFVLADGVTMYFSAESDESLGGLDLYITRYNSATHQYVRPENLGFPFNSADNDYLLAVDEALGRGILVSDRRQPDDKVCIYWFMVEDEYETYELDPDDEEELEELKAYAEIASIVATQEDADAVSTIKQRWKQQKEKAVTATTQKWRFVINDATVYNSLEQFTNPQARKLAEEWTQADSQLKAFVDEQEQLRRDYSESRSQRLQQRLINLEAQISQLRHTAHTLEKQYRAAELQR